MAPGARNTCGKMPAMPAGLLSFRSLFRFVPEVLTRARVCKHAYKHAVAPPSVSSHGHTVGTGNEFNSRGLGVPGHRCPESLQAAHIQSLLQHLMDKYKAEFACGDGESSESIPLRGARKSCHAESFGLL